MRVGLLSDTHILEPEAALPPQIAQAFAGVDLILHAGDIFIPWVLDELERVAPVLAAEGDGDDFGDILTDRRVKEKHVLKLAGRTVWLVHQRPPLYSRLAGQDRPDPGPGVPDVVVFGHDHRTLVETHSGVVFVNPGSPTFLNYRRGPGTVCILDIDSGRASARIVNL